MKNHIINKNIIMVWLCAIALLIPFEASANKAYKAFADSWLYHKANNSASMEKGTEIHKGDTVYTTEETEAYILENKDNGLSYLPIQTSGGEKGYMYYSNYYPIKIDASDRLTYVHDRRPENRSPLARFLVPTIEWAMNINAGPAGWLYGILICIGCALGFGFLTRYDKFRSIGLLLCGVSLVAVSACEIMYALSYEQSLLWFIMPSYIGGWGHTILNFILMAIVIGLQIFGIYYIWIESLDKDGSEPVPKWIKDFSFLPIILGVALMIMIWIDDNDISGTAYLLTLGSMIIPAGCGMAWMFRQKRFADGIIYPIILILSGIGLTCALMVMSMLIVHVAVVVAILAVAVIFGLGALSTLFGGEEVKVITNDGRTVRGTKNWDGTVTGYDGKKYHVK